MKVQLNERATIRLKVLATRAGMTEAEYLELFLAEPMWDNRSDAELERDRRKKLVYYPPFNPVRVR